jgi:hypothetical protein
MSGRTDTIIALANVAAIAAIGLVNIAAIWASIHRTPGVTRLLGGPLLPVLGLVSCGAELWLLGAEAAAVGMGLVMLGGGLYMGRKIYHDPVRHRELVLALERYGGPMLRTLRHIESRSEIRS